MKIRNLVVLLLAGSIGISAVSQIVLKPPAKYPLIFESSDGLRLGEFSTEGVFTKAPGITEAQVDSAFYKEWTRMRDHMVAAENANQAKLDVCIAGWKEANDDRRVLIADMQRQLAGISKTLKGGK